MRGSRSVTAGNLHGGAVLTPRYTQRQREAIAASYPLTTATAGRVAELAAAGELEHPSGATLGPFEIGESTVRSVARRARLKEAAADARTELADLPHRSAVEDIRRRLLHAIELEFDSIEIEQEQGRPVSGERLRQVARAAREVASIPGPNEPRPPKPGAKVDGVRDGSETRGGLAGKILAASRAGGFA
jgi:hypothetical protein